MGAHAMQNQFPALPALYSRVFSAVDASVTIGASLPGAEAAVQAALDQVRRQSRDPEAVICLESLSIGLSNLSGAGNGAGRAVALARLDALSRQWLERLPMQ